MNYLVKILVNDDGEKEENPKWHLQDPWDVMTFCQGELFDAATDCEFIQKNSDRGGITCPDCLRKVREIKAVKL